MIIVRLIGGLGNQLFQYALGRYLSIKTNSELLIDATGFDKYKLRKFELSNFNIKLNFVEENQLPYRKRATKNGRYLAVIKDLFLSGIKIVDEKNFHFDSEILTLSRNIYLDGYWQSEKYFEQIKTIIKNDFTFKSDLNSEQKKISKLIEESDSVSMHIRRGDYVNNSIYQCLSLDYYQNAINEISKHVKNPMFFIFSDEIEWVRKNINMPCECKFIDGNKSWEDLKLMTLCKHNIIANSTFSWWGAYLGSFEGKKVIAPETWFSEISNYTTKDLIPASWIKI